MEVLKRKILLENSVDRNYNSPTWGVLTATTFYINIILTQSMDDMGIFSDIEYFPKDNNPVNVPAFYGILIDKLTASGITFPFMSGIVPQINPYSTFDTDILRNPNKNEVDYYNFLNLKISGYTDSKLEDVRSYAASNPYRIGFDVNTETYDNYEGISVNGVNRIKIMGEPSIYVFDTPNDTNLGTSNQIYGIRYSDYSGETRLVTTSDSNYNLNKTQFDFIGEGWNMTNTSLSALTKEEYLFGIISPPEVKSDVFIDRGITSVIDKHLRLSEINDLGHLSRYGNGYYKLNKQ